MGSWLIKSQTIRTSRSAYAQPTDQSTTKLGFQMSCSIRLHTSARKHNGYAMQHMRTTSLLGGRRALWALVAAVALTCGGAVAQTPTMRDFHFRVVAFYTGKEDLAHISFVEEANRWFAELARVHGFTYDATTDWEKLNGPFLR